MSPKRMDVSQLLFKLLCRLSRELCVFLSAALNPMGGNVSPSASPASWILTQKSPQLFHGLPRTVVNCEIFQLTIPRGLTYCGWHLHWCAFYFVFCMSRQHLSDQKNTFCFWWGAASRNIQISRLNRQLLYLLNGNITVWACVCLSQVSISKNTVKHVGMRCLCCLDGGCFY